MVNLVPIGPCVVLMAYSAFTLEVFHSITRAGNTTTTGNKGSLVKIHIDLILMFKQGALAFPWKYLVSPLCDRYPVCLLRSQDLSLLNMLLKI